MAESQPSQSDLAAAAFATRALSPLAHFEQVALLDDHWTAHLEAAHREGTPEPPDFEGLLAVADQMDLALGAAAEGATELRELVEQVSDRDAPRVLDRMDEVSLESAEVLSQVLTDIDEESPTEAFIAACRILERDTGAERELLARKRETLSEGGLPDPDLSAPYRCAVTIATIGCVFVLAAGGAVSVLGVPVSITVGVLGGAGTLASTWKKSGCKKAFRKLKEAIAT